jgi:hypothetical protein
MGHTRFARALFEAGREANTGAEYERALEYFRQSYELSRGRVARPSSSASRSPVRATSTAMAVPT